MKSKVLDRPMFKQGLEVDPDNVGILQGFKDMLGDEWEDDDEEGYETVEIDEVSERRPDSPEILMNNLRGDMRSVEARVDELADLVGYGAASETPEAVLALLQPVLGAQEAMAAMPAGMPAMPPGAPAVAPQPPMPPGGIAALGGAMPAEMPMPAEAAMPTEAAMAAPSMEAPIAMRNGGIVQRFSNGSDPDGVTAQGTNYPPEFIERARTEITNFLAQKPTQAPDLAAAVAERTPLYQQILGTGDRSATQAQMLFDIAQAGLNLAAGTNAAGQPLRGRQSLGTRLGSAFQALPGQIGARVGEMEKEQRQVRLAALQGAEKDIANIREQNAKLIESQRKIFTDAIKSSGASPFGKGDWHWNVVNRPGLLANWAAGKTSEEQDNLVDSAITKFSTPRIENRVDPDTSLPYTVEIPGVVPPFVQTAIAQRKKMGVTDRAPAAAAPAAAATDTGTTTTAPAPAAAAAPTTTTVAGRQVRVSPGSTPTMPAAGTNVLPTAPGGGPGTAPTTAGQLPARSLWGTSSLITGPVSSTLGAVSGTPGLGDPFPLITQSQNLANQEVENLIEAFIKNDRAAVSEQERLRKLYSVGPRFWDDPAAYRGRLIAIDEELGREMNKASQEAYNDQLPSKNRQTARAFLQSAEKFRSTLGVPVRIYSADDPTYRDLPAGAEYLWQGTIPMVKGGTRGR